MADMIDNLAYAPGIRRISVKKKDVQDTLLAHDSQMMYQGKLYKIKAKHQAAGVYEMWLEPWFTDTIKRKG